VHEAELTLAMPAAIADAVARALRVEFADGPPGTVVRCEARAGGLHSAVTAADLAGLRASLTSVLRLADAAARSAELAG